MVSEEKTKRILFNKNDCSSARKDLINALKDTNKLEVNEKAAASK